MKQPLGMSPGVHSMKPMTMSHKPWKNMVRERTKLSRKLLGMGIPMRVVEKERKMRSCSMRWYCPSGPLWSAEWRWKRRSC